jgi:putative hemolysin
MKMFGLILFLLTFQTSAFALDLYLKVDPATTRTLRVSLLNGIRVSSECTLEKKHCLELLSKKGHFKNTKSTEVKTTLGNPASINCEKSGGASAILEDEKHNEYDYCVFENKYYVDSWDFYKKFKK